jgi:hypothetical protein
LSELKSAERAVIQSYTRDYDGNKVNRAELLIRPVRGMQKQVEYRKVNVKEGAA